MITDLHPYKHTNAVKAKSDEPANCFHHGHQSASNLGSFSLAVGAANFRATTCSSWAGSVPGRHGRSASSVLGPREFLKNIFRTNELAHRFTSANLQNAGVQFQALPGHQTGIRRTLPQSVRGVADELVQLDAGEFLRQQLIHPSRPGAQPWPARLLPQRALCLASTMCDTRSSRPISSPAGKRRKDEQRQTTGPEQLHTY